MTIQTKDKEMMDYMDCKELSEVAETYEQALKVLTWLWLQLEEDQVRRGLAVTLLDLYRQSQEAQCRYEEACAIYLENLTPSLWPNKKVS